MARTQHRSIRMDQDWLGLMRHARRVATPRTTAGAIVRRLVRLYLTDPAIRARVDVMPDPLDPATHKEQ